MQFTKTTLVIAAVFCYSLFFWGNQKLQYTQAAQDTDFIVLPPPLLLALYAGDPYLAANIETSRIITASNLPEQPSTLASFAQLHRNAARLNPCQQDNYYIANAILAWSGHADAALDILDLATKCRNWDDVPPFFYGFNSYYFLGKDKQAADYLEIAATRNPENASAYRRIAIMYQAQAIKNSQAALRFLQSEFDSTKDSRLKKSLQRRIDRIKGLIELENAQQAYEKKTGLKLKDPSLLIKEGYLEEFPKDPTRIGYLFDDVESTFRLKSLTTPNNQKKP